MFGLQHGFLFVLSSVEVIDTQCLLAPTAENSKRDCVLTGDIGLGLEFGLGRAQVRHCFECVGSSKKIAHGRHLFC